MFCLNQLYFRSSQEKLQNCLFFPSFFFNYYHYFHFCGFTKKEAMQIPFKENSVNDFFLHKIQSLTNFYTCILIWNITKDKLVAHESSYLLSKQKKLFKILTAANNEKFSL